MSDTSTNMNSEWAESPKAKGALPGAQLAAQREAMGLTVDQIADQLKLAPRQVMALEADDYASLPNMAVTRGFVRAYAKVVKLDAAPLVAMIEVNPIAGHEHPPVRREISASFTESRFPSMTERSGKPSGWLLGAAGFAVIAAAVGAYYVGLFPNLAARKEAASAPAVTAPAAGTPATAPAGAPAAPLQSANVPLISVPAPGEQGAAPAAGTAAQGAPAAATAGAAPAAPAPGAVPANPAVANAPAANAPATGAAAPGAVKPGAPAAAPAAVAATPAVAQPATPAPQPAATAGSGALVLKATEDSWITIQPPGKKALVSRMLKAGSTETFDIPEPALLIVGKPLNVQATLHGAPLELPPVPGGTISRVNIK